VLSVFLAVEVQSLLIGESADNSLKEKVLEVIDESEDVEALLRFLSVQQGPGQVLVLLKLSFRNGLTIEAVCEAINRFERKVRERCPEVRWCFVEPDIARSGTAAQTVSG
jgi:divalent metal cation (Fe/Co/Zn/Cd) transporter